MEVVAAPIDSSSPGWLPHTALLRNAPPAGLLPGFSRHVTLPFFKHMHHRNFFQKLRIIRRFLQKSICWKHQIHAFLPIGFAIGNHASILPRRGLRRKTQLFYRPHARADGLLRNPENKGSPTRLAARAGLLLGELALVNCSSCQLIILLCGSSQKSTSNFSETRKLQIQNFRAIALLEYGNKTPKAQSVIYKNLFMPQSAEALWLSHSGS
ncbi:hypothetical protein SD208_05550 [Ochrobactrum sp. BD67]